MIEVWFITCQNFVLYNFRSVSEFISAMNGTENLETKEEEAERIHFQKVMEQPESSKKCQYVQSVPKKCPYAVFSLTFLPIWDIHHAALSIFFSVIFS